MKYNMSDGTLTFSNGVSINQTEMERGGFGPLAQTIFKFSASLNQMNLDEQEFALLSVICLLSSGEWMITQFTWMVDNNLLERSCTLHFTTAATSSYLHQWHMLNVCVTYCIAWWGRTIISVKHLNEWSMFSHFSRNGKAYHSWYFNKCIR